MDILDSLIQHYTQKHYDLEVQNARQVYFENAGVLDESSPGFESRISQYLDWYIFDRPMIQTGHSPLLHWILENPEKKNESEISEATLLLGHPHSVFEVEEVIDGVIKIKCLGTESEWSLELGSWAKSFDPKSLFEGRIFSTPKGNRLSSSVCFHSSDARAFIEKNLKQIEPEDFSKRKKLMLALMKAKYKYEHSRSLKVQDVYSQKMIEGFSL